MDVSSVLVSNTVMQFENLKRHGLLQDKDTLTFAEQYVQDSFEIETPDQNLLAVDVRSGKPVRLIKFNPIAAAGVIAGLVSGVVGASNAIVLGGAVLSSIASVFSIFTGGSLAEAALFWVIYSLKEHTGSRALIEEKFNEFCETNKEIKPEDFSPALLGLLNMGIVAQEGEDIYITESLVFLWMRT